MTIELYGFPGTRASRVQWLLEELELPYEFHKVDVRQGEHKRPAHLELHPHGAVPVLKDGDLRLIESAAMVLHLVDKTGKLAPAIGTAERARFYQFVIYTAASFDAQMTQLFFHTVLLPPEQRDADKAAAAKSVVETGLAFIERELGDAEYLLGEQFSAADVTFGYALHLVAHCGVLAGRERISAYHDRLTARPAFKRAFADAFGG